MLTLGIRLVNLLQFTAFWVKFVNFIELNIIFEAALEVLHLFPVYLTLVTVQATTVAMRRALLLPVTDELFSLCLMLIKYFCEHALGHFVFF